jgi:hypothetical protein
MEEDKTKLPVFTQTQQTFEIVHTIVSEAIFNPHNPFETDAMRARLKQEAQYGRASLAPKKSNNYK